MTYTEFSVGDAPFGGMMEMNAQMVSMNVPPNWLTYFEVADVDATANKATSYENWCIAIRQRPVDRYLASEFLTHSSPVAQTRHHQARDR